MRPFTRGNHEPEPQKDTQNPGPGPARAGGPGGPTVTIERLAHGGYGVGYLDGLAVFVPRTAPGDVVDVRLTESRRRYAFGEIQTIRQASPRRVSAPCPLYDRCGGCHLQHLRYEDQLVYKTAQVQDAIARIGKLPDIPVAPMLESPQPFNYRNKVLYHYDAASGALGLVARHAAQILDVPHCLLNDPRADAVLARAAHAGCHTTSFAARAAPGAGPGWPAYGGCTGNGLCAGLPLLPRCSVSSGTACMI